MKVGDVILTVRVECRSLGRQSWDKRWVYRKRLTVIPSTGVVLCHWLVSCGVLKLPRQRVANLR